MKIIKIAENKKGMAKRYFSDSIIQDIFDWKADRNKMIHALMNQELSTDILKNIAISGEDAAKRLCTKSTCYKRALERKKNKTKWEETKNNIKFELI